PLKHDFFIDHFVVTNRVRISAKRWVQSMLGNRRRAIEHDHDRIGWTRPDVDPARYEPLGGGGGIARSLANMTKRSDLLKSRGIPLTIVVYPWAQQIAQNDVTAGRSGSGVTSAPAAARRSSTCFRPTSPSPTATRTGTNTSTSSATTIFRSPATACFTRSSPSGCCSNLAISYSLTILATQTSTTAARKNRSI